MPRVLIISERWPPAEGSSSPIGRALATAVAQAGYEVDVITNESAESAGESAANPAIIRLPFEPARESGFLFALRNALTFGAASNPGNYAMFRDRLHMHLQEVLYDTVIIICPPRIYLRLGFWIDESFGIPVWVHLEHPDSAALQAGFGAWNHRRLEKKYLAAARIVSTGSAEILELLPREVENVHLPSPGQGELRFRNARGGEDLDVGTLLRSISRKQR